MTDLKAVALSCTLKPSPAESSSVRVADHDVRFGVTTDEGDGDQWPAIRQKVLDADIMVLSTPIWMGQPSSVCKMVLERRDADQAD